MRKRVNRRGSRAFFSWGGAGLSLIIPVALAGCGKPQEAVLGTPPLTHAGLTIRDLTQAAPGAKVTLRGEMVEKCPVAGCWFVLRDKSGTVRVDTKAAGFVVSNVPLHTTMTVSGARTAGSPPGVAATGVRY